MAGPGIDVVETGAAQRDESSAPTRQCREHRRIDPIVDKHAHRAATSGERHRRDFEKIVEEDQLVASLGVGYSQQLAVVAFGAENGHLHGMLLLTFNVEPATKLSAWSSDACRAIDPIPRRGVTQSEITVGGCIVGIREALESRIHPTPLLE